jgi:hypothetical protein
MTETKFILVNYSVHFTGEKCYTMYKLHQLRNVKNSYKAINFVGKLYKKVGKNVNPGTDPIIYRHTIIQLD